VFFFVFFLVFYFAVMLAAALAKTSVKWRGRFLVLTFIFGFHVAAEWGGWWGGVVSGSSVRLIDGASPIQEHNSQRHVADR